MTSFSTICILGVGLLGGSVAAAARHRHLAGRIVGWGRSIDRLETAKRQGLIDDFAEQISDAARNADLVVAALPVQRIVAALDQAAPVAAAGAVLTDVGSTKATIAAASVQQPWASRFCPAHPIAGSDKSGCEHADGQLFQGKLVILTPTAATADDAASRCREFWEAVGGRVRQMPPDDHDAALAATSHLPHLLAAALAGATAENLLPLAGSGWCDTTRIAAGQPELWREIIAENRQHTLSAARGFATIWDTWVDALAAGDMERIEELLAEGKKRRDAVGNRHPSSRG